MKLGIKDAGYEYVNMDDCWHLDARADNGTGHQIPDPSKFPNGIKDVADCPRVPKVRRVPKVLQTSPANKRGPLGWTSKA